MTVSWWEAEPIASDEEEMRRKPVEPLSTSSPRASVPSTIPPARHQSATRPPICGIRHSTAGQRPPPAKVELNPALQPSIPRGSRAGVERRIDAQFKHGLAVYFQTNFPGNADCRSQVDLLGSCHG